MIRILIVDDEEPARVRLREMLGPVMDVEVTGEAESGSQAMRMAEELKPDVLLLDIQMPGCSGIDVAASLREPRPYVIFCTAYEQHAVDAFELNAVDYLLKPISRVRLEKALRRVRLRGTGAQGEALDHAVRQQRAAVARFLVRSGTHYLVVGEAEVIYFASEDGLTRMVSEGTKYWMDPTLNELEQRVDPGRFYRVSRAAIVNLNGVVEVRPQDGGSGEVVMRNGQRLEVSRRRWRGLLSALGAG